VTFTHVVLYRAMNLGHRGSPVRADLEGTLLEGGAAAVRSFQTNGTVLLDVESGGDDVAGAVARAAAPVLADVCGYAGTALVRSLDDVAAAVEGDPFALTRDGRTYRETVTFVDGGQPLSVALPWTDARDLLDLVAARPGVVLGVARELAIGLAIGFVLKLIFEAGALAGELVSQSTGLSFAQMSDPLRGVTSGVVAQWFYLGFGLLFFAADGHLALIQLLVDSYHAVPVGTALPDPHAFATVAPTFLLQVLRGGVTLALPMMVAMLAVNLAFGALAKAAPALNPVQLGLPVSVLLGLFLLAMLAGEMGPPVQRMFDASFDAARALTQ